MAFESRAELVEPTESEGNLVYRNENHPQFQLSPLQQTDSIRSKSSLMQSQPLLQLSVSKIQKAFNQVDPSEAVDATLMSEDMAESAETPATDVSFASKPPSKKLLFKNNSFYPRLKKLQQEDASQKLGFVLMESSSRSELLFKRNQPYKNDSLNKDVNLRRY